LPQKIDSFTYDPFGRRIYKSSSTGTSIYAYDGQNLIEETNASGAAVARYTQTENIDEPLAMLRSSRTSYYHADGIDAVTSLSETWVRALRSPARRLITDEINTPLRNSHRR
jgi:hypothetical protein